MSNVSVEMQRATLRAERRTLEERTVVLASEGEQIRANTDLRVIHAHNERLQRHTEALRVFRERLEAFHAEHGALGED